jgi:putative hydrolases of HD superfamily
MSKTPNSPSNLDRDVEFLYEVGTLRYASRTWNQFLNPLCQNLTEHTLRVIWIALVIAKHEGVVDTSKVVKMALVHDISESRSVDVNYVSRQYADRHEDKAIQDTLGGTVLDEEFLPIWEEYEEKESLEAKIVKDADNLDVDFELKELESMGNQLRAALQPTREHVAENKFYTETARQIWKAVQGSNPHSWHMLGKNRFTTGDWKK